MPRLNYIAAIKNLVFSLAEVNTLSNNDLNLLQISEIFILKKVELILVDNMDDVPREALVPEEGKAIFALKDKCETFRIKDSAEPRKDSTPGAVTAH